jgi:hypothetical protein
VLEVVVAQILLFASLILGLIAAVVTGVGGIVSFAAAFMAMVLGWSA